MSLKANSTTTDELLEKCCTPAGRKEVAESTGVGEGVILKRGNMADLMRVSGVGSQYSELLNAAGVDTIKELRTRNGANLTSAMEKVNSEKNLANATPAEATVNKWIEAAKTMDPRLTYLKPRGSVEPTGHRGPGSGSRAGLF